jgi:hypothetical protein
MRCDDARRHLSDRLDTLVEDPALDDHLDHCDACAAFDEQLGTLRSRLRLVPAEPPPDLVGPVAARLREEQRDPQARRTRPAPAAPVRRRRLTPAWAPALRAAAVFLVAAAVGAAAVGVGGAPPASAADLRTLVLAAQHRVTGLDLSFELVEHGWHPDVPERRYGGLLRYAAPETLWLELFDNTRYPDASWPPNDVELVVDGDTAWSAGRPACPTAAVPECLPDEPTVRATTGREPFDPAVPVPLDLVVPVAAFQRAAEPAELGEATIAGRDAVGTRVTAAQIDGLLDGLGAAGNLRPVHPTDPVEVWLDAALGVPLEVVVRAADSSERRRWGLAQGLVDAPGEPVLTWRVTRFAARDLGGVAAPPDGAETTAGPFAVGPAAAVPEPDWLPAGMRPHRRGTAGNVHVATWSDGRAWLKIRAHPAWPGGRLFGAAGEPVRRVPAGDGVAYLATSSGRVLVHAADVDVEVSGSLDGTDLLRIAASLDLAGRPVPPDWAEAATTTLAEVVEDVPGLLTVADPAGFDGPAVRHTDGVVTANWAGDGARGFVLTQRPGDVLRPPLDAVVIGVAVRGTAGRWSPSRGELEWTEAGAVRSLRSRTLGLHDLLGIAARLEPVS